MGARDSAMLRLEDVIWNIYFSITNHTYIHASSVCLLGVPGHMKKKFECKKTLKGFTVSVQQSKMLYVVCIVDALSDIHRETHKAYIEFCRYFVIF